jgi:hypothetical protein
LVNYTRYQGDIFEPEGRWLLDPEVTGTQRSPAVPDVLRQKYYVKGMKYGGHGHGHGIALISVLDYALAVGDPDLLQFSKNSFEWAKNPGPDFGVSTLVGWFPSMYIEKSPLGEGCPIGDMVSIGTKLSAAGVADYWDDIDRWVRNAFAEAQLTRTDWIYAMQENQPQRPVGPYQSADKAVERNIGGFSADMTGTEWSFSGGVLHCCTGTCNRAIYYVWEHMLDHKDDVLQVNLLLNRASEWADVHSYIPYQGRVDLKVRKTCSTVKMRAPEWVGGGSPDLVCEVNGARRSLRWEGRYVNMGAAKAGDTVVVRFPISERTVKERIGAETYTLVIKGNTVVSIDPIGKQGPLYQDREKYRRSEVAWVKVNRFVPEQEIDW